MWLQIGYIEALFCSHSALRQDAVARYDCSRLKDSYQREVRRSGTLSARLDEVLAERNSLREEVRDYDRVKRAFGEERVNEAVQQVKEQEAAERVAEGKKANAGYWCTIN